MRHLLAILMLMLALEGLNLQAQNDPVARARQQELEEQQRGINARLQNLEEALQAIQQDMNALRTEIRNLRDQASRASSGGQGSFQQLEEKIREVDRKRMTDQEKVLGALAQLERKATATSPRPRQPEKNTPPGKTYEYTIREGDVLSKIVRDLREQGLNISEAAIMKANPKVEWTKLQIGRTIIIPVPDK